ncbi:MAG: hypothetical protein RLZZ58_1455, partial [Pseudomonadota bacterium]
RDDGLLHAVDAFAARLPCRIALVATLDTLDALYARFAPRDDADLLVAPDDAACLLALARVCGAPAHALHDPARTMADARIDQLQDEVSRIVQMLSLLRAPDAVGLGGYAAHGGGFDDGMIGYAAPSMPDAAVRSPTRGYNAPAPGAAFFGTQPADGALVRRMIRQRRLRDRFFPADIFADPAWDMLLDLFAAKLERRTVSVSSLCIASAVPATTALRWIKSLTDAGVFVREADPHDGRRIFIALSETAETGMRAFCDAMATA